MIEIFRTDHCQLNRLEEYTDGIWINIVNPTSRELNKIAEKYDIEIDDLASSLDEEESSRITLEDGYTCRNPFVSRRKKKGL